MKRHTISLLTSGIALIVLAGCATTKPALEGSLDPNLGAAIRTNMQAQAVTPTAKQKANTYIPADPSRAALARKNYRENNVAAPVSVDTSGN